MCLIIHKPAGVAIPEELLSAAAAHNPDGWGLMGFDVSGHLLLEKHANVDVSELVNTEHTLRDAEYVLHLRRQTRGGSGIDNVHPFKVTDGIYLMHNGTLKIPPRVHGRSDTWHFVTELLRPLAQRHSGLLSDSAFLHILEFGLRADNKMALLDRHHRRIVIVNRQHGVELEGLWLSNTRWVDRNLFPLEAPPQPQERQYRVADLHIV
jgi:predicted glutamine amidotransferase